MLPERDFFAKVLILSFFVVNLLPCSGAAFILDQNTENNLSLAEELTGSLYLMDSRESKKPASWDVYKYVPTKPLSKGANYYSWSFKLVKDGKTILSRMPDDSHEMFWPVHPLTKLKNSAEIDRLPNQTKGYVRSISPIVDINGDGQPELIIGSRDFCAHGTWHYWVYSLGQTAKLYAEFPDLDLWPTIFADLDADRKYEAIRFDMTFQRWYDSEAGSAAPVVILSAGPQGFSLNQGLMRRTVSDGQMTALVDSIKKEFSPLSGAQSDEVRDAKAAFSVSPRLWRVMLDLIYTGNAQQCWNLVDQAWPKGKTVLLTTELGFQPHDESRDDSKLCPKTKESFISEFLGRLAKSSYFAELCKLNSDDKRMQDQLARSAGKNYAEPDARGDSTKYKSYLNPRYKFAVDYPEFLKPAPPPDNGDGLTFKSSDGKVELLAYGANLYGTVDSAAWTPSSLLATEVENRVQAGDKITLKRKGADWVVLSGYSGKQIFYYRAIIGQSGIKCFQLKYPSEDKAMFDKIIEHIARSLKHSS